MDLTDPLLKAAAPVVALRVAVADLENIRYDLTESLGVAFERTGLEVGFLFELGQEVANGRLALRRFIGAVRRQDRVPAARAQGKIELAGTACRRGFYRCSEREPFPASLMLDLDPPVSALAPLVDDLFPVAQVGLRAPL